MKRTIKMMMKNQFVILLFFFSTSLLLHAQTKTLPYLKVSQNGHYLMTEKGDPFFWLADTGWLMAQKLNHEDALKYLGDRESKGFNVLQIMVLHDVKDCNFYRDSALVNGNIVAPYMTNGKDFADYIQYDYWDNIEWIVDEAAKKGMYVALVPIWGSVIKKTELTKAMGRIYMNLLCRKLSNRTNVIWLIGGDIEGDLYRDVFIEMALSIKEHNPKQLITFHPRGRTQSSTWFHNETWLDFNMFQSGHKNYAQDSTGYGEDNWRYVVTDYNLIPAKPTLDGEPSYEAIPQGLHDTLQPRWTADDVRRYAYWSVFAGACGFTYGHNSVIQFYRKGDKDVAYGVTEPWNAAIHAQGAFHMNYLKKLMESKPYFDRVPDQSLIAGEQGAKYDYIAATRGVDYAFIYTYNGRNFSINTSKIKGNKLKVSWYNPKNGQSMLIDVFENNGVKEFNPPGEMKPGNDWVLILEKE
ncbi:MAG: glycoside hydrolase family 140 protein [Paludibacteraceae bacterium]|nr:glycoside hydrolase family 140 protein [Paludibacteraceae bacterium]MBN2788497.1 glycoside hydrolase family 140 protein [Paludibacteraceae bacterium]